MDSRGECPTHRIGLTAPLGVSRLLFDEVVEIDYRSLGAPEVTHDTAEQLERNWKAVLPGFDTTQHLLGSHVVDVAESGDVATCKSHVTLRGLQAVLCVWCAVTC
jgi:hypothetical protein